jgi:hypothetical protein
MAQGEQAVADVGAWYKQAGQMAAKQRRIAAGETRNTKKTLRKAKVAGPGRGIGNAEMAIGRKAIGGLGKAGREFFSELTAATATEGAASKTAVQRSFANQAASLRGDLRELKAQRRSAYRDAFAEGKAQLTEAGGGAEARAQASELYNDYLETAAKGGNRKALLRKAIATAPSPQVASIIAGMAWQNRRAGIEGEMIGATAASGEEKGMTRQDKINMYLKLAAANEDPIGGPTPQSNWYQAKANRLARMPKAVRVAKG